MSRPLSPASHPGAASPALSLLLESVVDCVVAVREGRSLTDAVAARPAALRAGTQALSFDVMRRLGGADAVREIVAARRPPPTVDALLVSALALLWPSERPAYADATVVDQTVEAANRRMPAAAGFLNAVLRRFVREREALVAAAQRTPVGAFNHPVWWIDRVKQDWPAQWQAVLAAANVRPPMFLRVNARRTTAAEYAQRLAFAGRSARVVGPHAVWLEMPCAVAELPGFADGDVSVQDAAAQRAAPLLIGGGESGGTPAALPRLAEGARVLDACAAPGGKTAHLLEIADLDMTAIDSDPSRIARIHDTLGRLKLSAAVRAADARNTRDWWDGRPFDAILLDAPCTGSGIVRRHPDIRWLRRAGDVNALAETQAQLLEALWPLLAPGGRLLFATCSVFHAEGRQRIDAFLQRSLDAGARLAPGSPGHLLPLADNGAVQPGGVPRVVEDGFFYALLHRPP